VRVNGRLPSPVRNRILGTFSWGATSLVHRSFPGRRLQTCDLTHLLVDDQPLALSSVGAENRRLPAALRSVYASVLIDAGTAVVSTSVPRRTADVAESGCAVIGGSRSRVVTGRAPEWSRPVISGPPARASSRWRATPCTPPAGASRRWPACLSCHRRPDRAVDPAGRLHRRAAQQPVHHGRHLLRWEAAPALRAEPSWSLTASTQDDVPKPGTAPYRLLTRTPGHVTNSSSA
jgi:hypothetical protein